MLQSSKFLKESLSEFYQWFVGFSDAESSFWFQPILNTNNTVKKVNWVFSIELHKDDLNVLNFIKDTLGIGNIRLYKDKCVLTVTNTEAITQLICIFDQYKLNSTKYLDFLNFKEAFIIYQQKNDSTNALSKEELANKLIELKNGMNTKRVNTTMPLDHKITITKSWLLGYLEGDGSFYISRTDLEPVFTLTATEEQYFLFEKIKEFLTNNLGFDKYSLFKLKCTKAIAINKGKARNNGKPSLTLTIKNIKFLNNYFIPFFENTVFISKKGLDFLDFKLISTAVYKGAHKIAEIRTLILKLTYTMNNFRLSTYNGSIEVLSANERNMIASALPLIEYLKDGRIKDLNNNSILTQPSSCIYEIVNPKKDIVMLDSLKEVLTTVGVNFKVLKKQLDIEGKIVDVNGYTIKRIEVFSKR